jgi:glycosyltransferase involved in cell wall biosynthesis
VCVVTNLFPSRAEPGRATFNKQQITALKRKAQIVVVAPVPMFGYSTADVPLRERVADIEVAHPRYLVIPKTMRWTYGLTFFLGIHDTLVKLSKSFQPDVIFATWAYPDAMGSALSAWLLKKPLAIKVHGSDINTASEYFLRRTMIRWACRRARCVIAVTEALKETLVKMGVDRGKVHVLPNGIDTDVFVPLDQAECRTRLGWNADEKVILYVGNFKPVKGVDILVKAMSDVAGGARLVMVGDGELQGQLQRMAKAGGLEDRVTFVPRQDHTALPVFFSAADVFCLPSRNEGCPNVLLEAAACGVPSVAARVGGVPDIIHDGIGLMAEPENPRDLAEKLNTALESPWDRLHIASSVMDRGWKANGEALFGILKQAVDGG